MSALGTRYRRPLERVLAAVLFVAAGMKAKMALSEPGQFVPGFLGSPSFRIPLIEIEALIAVWLLVGGAARARALVALGCFSALAIFSVYEAAHAISICGCFGTLRIPPAATAIFDLSAVIALWITRPRRNDHPESQPLRIGFLGATATAAVICGVLFAYRSASGRPATGSGFVILDPAALVNRKFPLVDEIDGSGKLKNGRWLLLFYHSDCDECLEAIPAYRAWATAMRGHSGKARLAFIAMPPFAPSGQDPISSSPDFLHLRLPPNRELLATTPLAVVLQDGHVLAATAGDQAIKPPDEIAWRH